jgi:hypothetical protein
MTGKALATMLGAALLGAPICAQQSASFKLDEHVLNAGGHPSGGVVMESTSYRVTLDALGESVGQAGMTSASFHMDAGFTLAYPPPGEVTDLLFTGVEAITWSAERSAGFYDLYRDDTSDGYGTCEQQNLQTTTATDSSIPTAGNTLFYLVTVKNRLQEEGTKGSRSDGTERLGATDLPVCP